MKRKLAIITFSCLLAFISLTVLSSQTLAQDSFDVLVVGEDIPDYLMDRITLDPSFVIVERNIIGSAPIDNFDNIIILDYAPTLAEISLLESYTGGIVIFVYENIASNGTMLNTLGLATTATSNVLQNVSLPVPVEPLIEHPILDNIQWNSVPTIRNYTDIQLTGTILLETSADSSDPGITLASTSDNNRLIVFNFFPDMDFNGELVEWPYFNYMLYLTIMSTVDEPVLTYAKWDYSPVPHTLDTILLGVSVLVTATITVVGFIFVRKYSKRNPVKTKDLEGVSKEVEKENQWEEVGM
ncbi:MAG: hypothetical protein H7647_01810, partial [Candidatus Heimdallarchaeota archaeon]|nr:hypothetical protein [Candidatus Heimdallarchaeota archaeon]MCK4253164.1 hypothetical protein [Candidatus Heimdallarchaeota archaeon]